MMKKRKRTMPYDPKNPPVKKVKGLDKLTPKQQRQWTHAFNSVYAKLKKENDGKALSSAQEERAFKQAWGAVKSHRRKKASDERRVHVIASALATIQSTDGN
jgi:cation transport regulator ChaB